MTLLNTRLFTDIIGPFVMLLAAFGCLYLVAVMGEKV